MKNKKVSAQQLEEFIEKRVLEIIYPKLSDKKILDKDWYILEAKSSKNISFEFKARHPISFNRVLHCVTTYQNKIGNEDFSCPWELIDEQSGMDKLLQSQPLKNKLAIAELLGFKK